MSSANPADINRRSNRKKKNNQQNLQRQAINNSITSSLNLNGDSPGSSGSIIPPIQQNGNLNGQINGLINGFNNQLKNDKSNGFSKSPQPKQKNQLPPTKKLGLTNPICIKPPKAYEEQLTESLKQAMEPYKVFDTPEGMAHRMKVLTKLNKMVDTFVKDVVSRRNPNAKINKITGKIYTFGSYRLGVHTQGADIDTLCVVPNLVTIDDFFTDFYNMLDREDCVTDLRAIPTSYQKFKKCNSNEILTIFSFIFFNFC